MAKKIKLRCLCLAYVEKPTIDARITGMVDVNVKIVSNDQIKAMFSPLITIRFSRSCFNNLWSLNGYPEVVPAAWECQMQGNMTFLLLCKNWNLNGNRQFQLQKHLAGITNE
jgi:hypothetical protein